MITGIYKLTFPSGMYYIGKSVDVSARWRQHHDTLVKGKHSQRMQAEFNFHKDYTQQVVLECHKDHLDIMEGYYINSGNKALMLNTIYPPALTTEQYAPLLANPELLRYSTSQHVKALVEQTTMINNLTIKINTLKTSKSGSWLVNIFK